MGLSVVFLPSDFYNCIATAFRRKGLQSAPVICEGKEKCRLFQFSQLTEDDRAHPGTGCDASHELRRLLHQNNTWTVLKRSSLVALSTGDDEVGGTLEHTHQRPVIGKRSTGQNGGSSCGNEEGEQDRVSCGKQRKVEKEKKNKKPACTLACLFFEAGSVDGSLEACIQHLVESLSIRWIDMVDNTLVDLTAGLLSR